MTNLDGKLHLNAEKMQFLFGQYFESKFLRLSVGALSFMEGVKPAIKILKSKHFC